MVLLAAAMSPLLAQTPTESVVFKGTADATYNGQTIILYNNATSDLDSAKVTNGAFELKVTYKGPTRYFFYSKYEAKQKGGYAPYGVLIAAPGEVGFKADMANIANSVITNAPENTLYSNFSKEQQKNWDGVETQLIAKYGKDYSKHFNPKDSLYKEASVYYTQLSTPVEIAEKQNSIAFINAHPQSYASMYLLQQYVEDMSADSSEMLYNKLSDKYKDSRAAKSITAAIKAERMTGIGKDAPEFTQADTAGKPVKLSDFRGKYVLVDFWASWCGPCRAENPNVLKAYQQYHDKGFTVLGVSLDRAGDKDKWLNAIHHDHLVWTQVSDLQFWKNEAAVLYGVSAIPQNFLIGPDGKIVAKSLHGDELTAKLEEIFNKK